MLTAVADTHTIIWYLFGDKQLSAPVGAFFTATAGTGDQIGISSITPTEIIYLIEKGKIPPDTFSRLKRALVQPPTLLIEIPLDIRITGARQAIARAQVPDMPDRIIAATALYFGVPVLTRDAAIQGSNVQTIW
ncbi:MAG TPA: PIN domain-containing protein [Chloroflexia bacterium]|nr:PIN domain-containing protein [Chloroflexia bacterium]